MKFFETIKNKPESYQAVLAVVKTELNNYFFEAFMTDSGQWMLAGTDELPFNGQILENVTHWIPISSIRIN